MSAHTNGTKKFLYLVRHEHESGVNTGLLRSDHNPDPHEAAEALHWSFAPDKGEELEITRVDEDSIINLKPRPNKGHA